jgi:hypothetical protein
MNKSILYYIKDTSIINKFKLHHQILQFIEKISSNSNNLEPNP